MGGPIAEDRRARDEHRSATILTLLVFLWGAISLAVVPWEPFWIPNLGQAVVTALLLVYFVRTWNRPRRRVAELISSILIAYTLLLLPWTAIVWCRLGRPLEAFTVPQLAIICVALVFPGRMWRGIAVMLLFAAEAVFPYAYAHAVGLGELVPISEPMSTFGYITLGLGLFILRWRRGDLTRRYVHVQAEIQALDRIRPLFDHAREELHSQIGIVAAEAALPRPCGRALDRLGELHRKLGVLLVGEVSGGSPQEAEQRLRDHDAQLGATFMASLGVVLALPISLWSRYQLGDVPTPWFGLKAVVDVAILINLVRTRHRPSSRRALWSVIVIYATALAVSTFNQTLLLQLDRPYAPFLGHKLLMVTLGLTLAARFKLGVALVLLTAAHTLALWFILDLGAHRDIVSVAEPWVTLTFMFVGLISLRILEQRQIVSIRLLRAETEASTMRRRALMFLALRDRLNSPLQTLVLGAASATLQLGDTDGEQLQAAIDRLVNLSHELADIDVNFPPTSESLDADAELRRHL